MTRARRTALPLHDQCRATGLPMPAREVRFHATRKWRFDYAWGGEMLAVEVDGGTWMQGRHSRGAGYEKDCEKLAEAAILGWRVVRVTTDMVLDGRAIDFVARALGAERQVESLPDRLARIAGRRG